MVYGVLRFINLRTRMSSWWARLSAIIWAGACRPGLFWGASVVLVGAMASCAVLGMTIERLAYRPLRGAPTLNVLITAIGVSLLLEYSGQVFFGAAPRSFHRGSRPPSFRSAASSSRATSWS